MDLRIYYGKVREQEKKITEEFPIVVSAETPDGGKAGVMSEVPKRVAAKMIVDGLARLAKREEANTFAEDRAAAIRAAQDVAQAAKLAVNIITSAGLERLQSAMEPPKA
jgi:hypothetical protein